MRHISTVISIFLETGGLSGLRCVIGNRCVLATSLFFPVGEALSRMSFEAALQPFDTDAKQFP